MSYRYVLGHPLNGPCDAFRSSVVDIGAFVGPAGISLVELAVHVDVDVDQAESDFSVPIFVFHPGSFFSSARVATLTNVSHEYFLLEQVLVAPRRHAVPTCFWMLPFSAINRAGLDRPDQRQEQVRVRRRRLLQRGRMSLEVHQGKNCGGVWVHASQAPNDHAYRSTRQAFHSNLSWKKNSETANIKLKRVSKKKCQSG